MVNSSKGVMVRVTVKGVNILVYLQSNGKL